MPIYKTLEEKLVDTEWMAGLDKRFMMETRATQWRPLKASGEEINQLLLRGGLNWAWVTLTNDWIDDYLPTHLCSKFQHKIINLMDFLWLYIWLLEVCWIILYCPTIYQYCKSMLWKICLTSLSAHQRFTCSAPFLNSFKDYSKHFPLFLMFLPNFLFSLCWCSNKGL